MTTNINQNSQPKAASPITKGCRQRISQVALSGVLLVLISCCVFAYLIGFSSDQAAYALVPPLYPNSSLSGKWVSGGTDSSWDRRTYLAGDSPEIIATYYQDHLTGAAYRFENGVYSFGKCDHSPLAKAVAGWINEGRYPFYTADNVPLPCVSIYIDTADHKDSGTPYQLNIEWPSL